MTILLDIIYIILFIFYIPILCINGKWHKGFIERLGFWSKSSVSLLKNSKYIWIHAVSVGELMAIKEVVNRIYAKTTFPIVITTVTKTGYSIAKKNFSDKAIIFWAPLDFSWVIKKFISLVNPVCCIIAETELWPNKLNILAKRGVPTIIVNGRISDQSFESYKKAKWFMQKAIASIRILCMQTDMDVKRIRELGVATNQAYCVGNLKYDIDLFDVDLFSIVLKKFKDSQVFLAASTHPGEDEIILDVFNKQNQNRNLLLVIVPRHPERALNVCDIVKQNGLKPILYSDYQNDGLELDEVLVVDQVGVLLSLYQTADMVFVGKSLRGIGGQNIIEPASMEKPIIVGPNMQNFRQVVEDFKHKNAIIQVKDEADLSKMLSKCLDDKSFASSLAKRAKSVVQANRGATQRTMFIIDQFIYE